MRGQDEVIRRDVDWAKQILEAEVYMNNGTEEDRRSNGSMSSRTFWGSYDSQRGSC